MSERRFTKKQKQMYDFIADFIDQYGYSPTFREIASGLNYRSIATVSKHIDNLIANGWLVKTDRVGRSLELVNGLQKHVVINQELLSHLQSVWPKLTNQQRDEARHVFKMIKLDGLIDKIEQPVDK